MQTLAAKDTNYGFSRLIVLHLAYAGVADFVHTSGSTPSNQFSEGEIRESLIEGDQVDCMVALPGQLFYSKQMPVCLGFLAENKQDAKRRAGANGHINYSLN